MDAEAHIIGENPYFIIYMTLSYTASIPKLDNRNSQNSNVEKIWALRSYFLFLFSIKSKN